MLYFYGKGGKMLKKYHKIVIITLVFISLSLGLCCAKTFPQKPKILFNNQALNPIIDLIENATETIDIQMFSFTNYDPIIQAIKKSAQKGVEIRIYADNQDANNPQKKNKEGKILGLPEADLEELGVQIRWETSSKYMHRKIAIFDQENFIIGSTNWTKNGFQENDEADIVMSDCDIACQLTEQFEKDWQKSSQNFSK